MYSIYTSPSKPATAQSPGSVCHTTLHNRLDLYSSWCSKCAVIAQSHMDSGVFIVSHRIYSSVVHVIMKLALTPRHHLPFPSLPFWMLFKGIVMAPVRSRCARCCLIGGNLFCVMIIGGDLCSNDPCWEVLGADLEVLSC